MATRRSGGKMARVGKTEGVMVEERVEKRR